MNSKKFQKEHKKHLDNAKRIKSGDNKHHDTKANKHSRYNKEFNLKRKYPKYPN